MFLFGIFFIFAPFSSHDDTDKSRALSAVYSLRFTFFFVYVVFASAFCIQTFSKYGINYLYIFDFDPRYKMNSHQLYKVGSVLLFIWTMCFSFSLVEMKMFRVFFDTPIWPTLIIVVFMAVYCTQPCCKCGYRTARKQVAVTLLEILKAPFGRVRFRDFFMADILCSASTTLNDFAFTIHYLTQLHEREIFSKPSDFNHWNYYFFTVRLAPSWFRMMQCLNKYHNSGMKVNLYNFGKYSSKFICSIIEIIFIESKVYGGNGFYLWAALNIFTTTYSTLWDFYMDWGLFRSFEKGSFLLRKQMKFHVCFYYWAILSNTFLRFFWVLMVYVATLKTGPAVFLAKWGFNVWFYMLAELLRRTQWALLRVENEFFNNYEQYRSIPVIPSLMDDVRKTVKVYEMQLFKY